MTTKAKRKDVERVRRELDDLEESLRCAKSLVEQLQILEGNQPRNDSEETRDDISVH